MTKDILTLIVDNGLYFSYILIILQSGVNWFISFKLCARILGLNNIGLRKILPAIAIMSLFSSYLRIHIPASATILVLVALVSCLLAVFVRVGVLKAVWTAVLVILLSFIGDITIFLVSSLDRKLAFFFTHTSWGVLAGSFLEGIPVALLLLIMWKFKHFSLIPAFKMKKLDLFDTSVVFAFVTMLYVVAYLLVKAYISLRSNPWHFPWDLILAVIAASADFIVVFLLLTVSKRREKNERDRRESEQKQHDAERKRHKDEQRLNEERIKWVDEQNQKLYQLLGQLETSKQQEVNEVKKANEEYQRQLIEMIEKNNMLKNELYSKNHPADDTKPENPDNLSKNDLELIKLVARNKSTEEIGAELHVSNSSVIKYISNLYQKLGLKNNRVEIALYAVRYGIVKREEIVLNRDESEM